MLFFNTTAAGPELDDPLLGFSFFGLGGGAPGEIENTVSAGALANALGRTSPSEVGEGSVRVYRSMYQQRQLLLRFRFARGDWWQLGALWLRRTHAD